MANVTDNWMSTVDLGTYKWTFYIVNTAVYNNPSILGQNDTAALNSGGAVIISESGVTGSYALENLIMQSAIVPGDSNGSALPTGAVFEIYEPLGFSLLDRILAVGVNMGKPSNLFDQRYVLKLEFLGRDRNTGATKKFPGTFLYKTKITSIKGSLGPAGAKYFLTVFFDIKASQTETVTPVDSVVTAVTNVSNFASNLEKSLNNMEYKLMRPQEIVAGYRPPRQYTVTLGSSTNIKTDPTKGIVAFDLSTQPWAGTADTGTASGESANTENPDTRDIVINSETQLTQKIPDLISRNVPSWSTYVNESRDSRFYTPYIYAEVTEELVPENDTTTNQQRKILHIVIHVGIDQTTPPSDASTTRSLQTTPGIQRTRFAGLDLVKKYNYLYTGENTEIINFQLDIQNLFTVALSPAAGIYYADNRQQFTPANPIKITTDKIGAAKLTSNQTKNSGAKFLSDIKLDRIDIGHSVVFDRFPAGSATQQKNEHTAISDDIAASIAQQSARREGDATEVSLELRGDPFWMGTPDSVVVGADNRFISNFQGSDALIGFVNYQANADDLLKFNRRGPVDMISTGVYKVTRVESKFQQGQFTQTLTAFKDQNTNVFLVLEQLLNIQVT